MPHRKCLIGIGSPHGDDQVGWRVADHIARESPPDVTVLKVATPLDILDHLEGLDWLGLCDACVSGGPVGQIHHWDWPDDRIQSARFTGTHDFDLPAALKLAEKLGRLPPHVTIWGIEIDPESLVPLSVLDATKHGTESISPRPGTPGRGVGGEGKTRVTQPPHPLPLSPEYGSEGSQIT